MAAFPLEYPGEKSRTQLAMVLAIVCWLALIVGTLGIALIYILFGALFYLFAQSAFISYLRGSAVKISAEQFPDLQQRLQRCCEQLGVARVPDAYLLHADGLFNALATRFLGRDYIVLFSSVVDALDSDPDAIDFYIGHELGHIRRRHLVWAPVLMIVAWLPLLGAALRRAQEYSCDRHGLAACVNADAAYKGLAALAAGHSRRTALSLAAYQQQRFEVTGFWASYHELVGDYPWLAKRVHAVQALAEGTVLLQPARNPFAFVLALFTPRVPGGGGIGLVLLAAFIGIVAAVAVPAYQQYVERADMVEYGGDASAADASAADAPRDIDLYQAETALAQLMLEVPLHQDAYTAFVLETQQWPISADQIRLPTAPYQYGEITISVELDSDNDLQYTLYGAGFDGDAFWMIPSPIMEGDAGVTALEWSCNTNGMPAEVAVPGC